MEEITLSTFQINDEFKVYFNNDSFTTLTLYKIRKLKHFIKDMEREPFALIFKDSNKQYIESGMYRMEQDRIGSFELCINPTIAEYGHTDAYYYEAVFC